MTIEEFKKQITELASNNSNTLIDLENFIVNYYKTKPLTVATLNPELFVRCSKNNDGEIFKNVARCSYNPIIDDIPIQRCNYPGQQVFYASVPSESIEVSTMVSAISEVMLKTINQEDISRAYLTLSRWKIRRPLNIFLFPFAHNIKEQNKTLYDASLRLAEIIDKSFEDKYRDAKEYFLDSLKFISDCLCDITNKEVNYRITSAFYNGLQRLNGNLDGMVYPSANTLSAGTNVVLNKKVVDDKIVFCDAIVMYAMQRDPANKKYMSFADVSDSVTPDENGNFCFKYVR